MVMFLINIIKMILNIYMPYFAMYKMQFSKMLFNKTSELLLL